jgi:hypothetical protein
MRWYLSLESSGPILTDAIEYWKMLDSDFHVGAAPPFGRRKMLLSNPA